MRVEDLDVEQRCVMVIGAKGGKPRLAPLSPEAARYLLRYLRHRAVHPHAASPALWLGERDPLADQGIRQVLERRGAPSAHAFRRGWCVDSLRTGVSQTSVQAAAGCAGPAMVSRYSSTLRDRPGGHDRADRATAGLTPDAQPPPAFRSVVLGGRPGRGCPDSAVAGSSASPSQSAAGPGRSVTP